MIGIVIFILSLALVVGCLGMLLRNGLVFEYRRRLLEKVSAAARRDIESDNYDWSWRYETFEAVSYDKMMFEFWKRLDSFYPDKSFIGPTVKRKVKND